MSCFQYDYFSSLSFTIFFIGCPHTEPDNHGDDGDNHYDDDNPAQTAPVPVVSFLPPEPLRFADHYWMADRGLGHHSRRHDVHTVAVVLEEGS